MELLPSVVGLCLLLGAQAQGPQIGFCNTYQTTEAFDETFITETLYREDGYSVLLTSGPNDGCRKLKFFSDGTFFYEFIDATSTRLNSTGTFQASPFSYSSPASITLSSLPYGELGSVLGTVNLNVLKAGEDRLALLSCVNVGLIRTQQLHILVPELKSSSMSAEEVNGTIQDIPLAGYLEAVQQTCIPDYRRQLPGLHLIRNLFAKIGIYLPFYLRQGETDIDPSLHAYLANPDIYLSESNALAPASALQEASPFAGYVSQPSFTTPSFVYPQRISDVGLQSRVPYVVGQQVIPQVQTGFQFGVQQFQNPAQAYPSGPIAINGFSQPVSQFFGAPVPSDVFLSPSPVNQANSVQFLRSNLLAQPIPAGKPETGAYTALYQG